MPNLGNPPSIQHPQPLPPHAPCCSQRRQAATVGALLMLLSASRHSFGHAHALLTHTPGCPAPQLLLALLVATAVFVSVPRGVSVGTIEVHSTKMTFNATTLTYHILLQVRQQNCEGAPWAVACASTPPGCRVRARHRLAAGYRAQPWCSSAPARQWAPGQAMRLQHVGIWPASCQAWPAGS